MFDRLAHLQLTRQLGTGRVPLRDSLAWLEGVGSQRSDSGSAAGLDFGTEDALEIYWLRLLLDPFAAQLAAERRSPRLAKRLRTLLAQMTESTRRADFRKLNQADLSFHLAIARASGHKRLLGAYESCRIQVLGTAAGRERLLTLPAETTALQHEAIVAAIEQGDGEEARQAAYRHVQDAMALMTDGVRYGTH
jgi:DNA-binding GntR family transcriptional regulator